MAQKAKRLGPDIAMRRQWPTSARRLSPRSPRRLAARRVTRRPSRPHGLPLDQQAELIPRPAGKLWAVRPPRSSREVSAHGALHLPPPPPRGHRGATTAAPGLRRSGQIPFPVLVRRPSRCCPALILPADPRSLIVLTDGLSDVPRNLHHSTVSPSLSVVIAAIGATFRDPDRRIATVHLA